ncbi:hypothetical protein [Trichothermofontia sp.]
MPLVPHSDRLSSIPYPSPIPHKPMGRQAKLRKHRQLRLDAPSADPPTPLSATDFVAAMAQQGYTLTNVPPAPTLPKDSPLPQV